MSLGHPLTSTSLQPFGSWLPWQFRARPALVTAVGSIVAVLSAVGLLVVARRLTGALSRDLSPDGMLLVALVAAAALTLTRVAWRHSFPLESPADLSLADQLLGWTSSAALALLAIGCCYPAYRTADWLIWLPILVADQLWRQNFFDGGVPCVSAPEAATRDSVERPASPGLASPGLASAGLASAGLASAGLAIAGAPQHDDILQQLYRVRDEQGFEVIYGTVRADFVAGQRTAVVHIGFCPPLARLPEIEAEALRGPAAKIKVVQALAHGTRLDVRLSAAAETDCQVWIDIAARPVGAGAAVNLA